MKAYRGPMDKHTAWCLDLFKSMKDGGIWGIPRSGLVFQRRGDDKLVLISAMPVVDPRLVEQQESDFEQTRIEFGLAGIEVSRLQ
jgi:hypothetical protein